MGTVHPPFRHQVSKAGRTDRQSKDGVFGVGVYGDTRRTSETGVCMRRVVYENVHKQVDPLSVDSNE